MLHFSSKTKVRQAIYYNVKFRKRRKIRSELGTPNMEINKKKKFWRGFAKFAA